LTIVPDGGTLIAWPTALVAPSEKLRPLSGPLLLARFLGEEVRS
jgi:hypothetical protein